MKHANTYKYINKERLSTPDLWSQARKVWKNNEAAETGLERGTEAKAGGWPTVWRWWIARTFAAIVDVLSDIHNALIFSANFQSGRGNGRIAPLAERILKIKPEKLLSENDLQLLLVDATEQRIERPKNQGKY